MKCFVNTMVDVLSANMRHAVGYPSDRFHFQQSGTSASAIDKLLNCDGFLAICCPDATRCLCPAAATQRTGMSHTPRNGCDRRRLRKCSLTRPGLWPTSRSCALIQRMCTSCFSNKKLFLQTGGLK